MKRLLVLVLLTAAAFSPAQKLRFVVAGDGRAASSTSTRSMDKNGVNTVITGEIASAVVKERAKFLLWTGDLVYGYTDDGKLESQLKTWLDAMSPVYKAGIKVLPTRGNHEAGREHNTTDATEVWKRIMNPLLPREAKKDDLGLSFTYTDGPVQVLGLDLYSQPVWETPNQAFVDRALAGTRPPFVFAFAHEEMFFTGSHKDYIGTKPHNEVRNMLLNSLMRAGSRVYFCGHDHYYDHMIVTKEGQKPEDAFHQLTAGTAGATFYEPTAYDDKNGTSTKEDGWTVTRDKAFLHTYGYSVVDIDGNSCTITFKGRVSPGEYVPMERFTFKVGASARAATSFKADVLPLFTAQDIECMRRYQVRLDDYSYMKVKAHADQVLGVVKNGTMPPNHPWPASKVELLKQWIDGGLQP